MNELKYYVYNTFKHYNTLRHITNINIHHTNIDLARKICLGQESSPRPAA